MSIMTRVTLLNPRWLRGISTLKRLLVGCGVLGYH